GLSGMAPARPVPGGVAASVLGWRASGVPRWFAARYAPTPAAHRFLVTTAPRCRGSDRARKRHRRGRQHAYFFSGSKGRADLWTMIRNLPSLQRRKANVLSTVMSLSEASVR